MDTFKTTPMVDLVTQLPGLVYNPPRLFDDPDVARYTRDTGPELGAMPRAVFRELGVYVDPTTGKCEVLMETLANILECSTATVSRAIRTCEYAGLVEIHEIQTRNNRTRFSYTLKAGLLANWMPTPKPYRGKLTVADHRLKLMTDYQNRIAELEALLEGAVNPETGEFIVSQKRNNVAEVVESGFATNEGKEEEVANSKKEIESRSSSVPILSAEDVPGGDSSDLDAPPDTFTREYVRYAMKEHPKWLAAWTRGLGAAFDYYGKNWPKFLEDLEDHRSEFPVPTQRKYETILVVRPPCSDCGMETHPSRLRDGVCTLCRNGVTIEVTQ